MIVFITPETEKENYIKRVVALENDTVEVRNDYVYINGQPCPIRDSGPFNYAELDEHRNFQSKISTRRFIEQIGQIEHPILRKTCATNRDCARTGTMCNYQTNLCRQSHFGPYKIPPKHVFVMGDNRDNSRDSRVWFSVPFNFIKGKAKFIWWSYRENRVQWERMFTKLR
jgi:signal peptidase I